MWLFARITIERLDRDDDDNKHMASGMQSREQYGVLNIELSLAITKSNTIKINSPKPITSPCTAAINIFWKEANL